MQAQASTAVFSDRRASSNGNGHAGQERRQFGNSYDDLSPPARELAERIDQYKLHNRRRFITYEELYQVIESLGYQRS